jgi:chemotaxis protein methyltransferase CheR
VRDEAGSEGTARRSGLHARLEEEAYRGLRNLVLAAGGIDLNRYKDRCVLRRIAVRQRASGAADLRGYLRLVGRDPVEREHLVKALTIHVSQFLRNPTTFRAIQTEVLPAILTDKARMGGRALRLWSVGCACGEEPYSLALLLSEMASETVRKHSTTIYGTDIEPECLRVAREARYPALSLKSVPAHWKQHYFTPVGLDYQVRPEIRRLVYFKLHSILDPVPFGRIDLVVFRNVLIYMTDPLQEQVLLRLSEALNVGGYLVLGKVEGLAGSARELFEPVNVPERIYRKRGHPASEQPSRGLEVLWK